MGCYIFDLKYALKEKLLPKTRFRGFIKSTGVCFPLSISSWTFLFFVPSRRSGSIELQLGRLNLVPIVPDMIVVIVGAVLDVPSLEDRASRLRGLGHLQRKLMH